MKTDGASVLPPIKACCMKNVKRNDSIVIIPAFREEKNIGKVVSEIKRCVDDIDIVVVDDGSPDKTAMAAQEAGAHAIRLFYNMGYGTALQTGFKYALLKKYKYAVQIDADGQHEPKYVGHLLSVVKSGEADVAIGSRFLGQGNYNPTLPRKIGMFFFGLIATLFTGQKVTDPTSGYQAINRNVIKVYAGPYYPSDYPDADVIIMLYKMGFKVQEVPVVMYEDVTTHQSMHSGMKPVYYIFKMCLSIFVTLLRKYK